MLYSSAALQRERSQLSVSSVERGADRQLMSKCMTDWVRKWLFQLSYATSLSSKMCCVQWGHLSICWIPQRDNTVGFEQPSSGALWSPHGLFLPLAIRMSGLTLARRGTCMFWMWQCQTESGSGAANHLPPTRSCQTPAVKFYYDSWQDYYCY